MNHGRNVVVTCGGKWVGIVLQLREAMRRLPAYRSAKILVASSDALTPAGCFADLAILVPLIRDPEYVDRLYESCVRHDVGLVIPLIDLDLDRLAPHIDRFAEAGIVVACPPPSLVELCLDKLAFSRFAEEQGLSHPATVQVADVHHFTFPVFRKRRRGFGSIDSGVCETLDAAKSYASAVPDLIFQEVIDAPELTVDAYIAKDGRAVVRVPRIRDKLVAGEVFKSHTVRMPAAEALADRTVASLAHAGLRGPLNVQMFLTAQPTLIEVNTRLGSGSVLSNVATDGRILAAILTEALGETAIGDPDDFRSGLYLSRFYGDVIHESEDVVAIYPR